MARGKRRARKVHRVVRHIEVWSVFKIAVPVFVCLYVALMVSGYLLWSAAESAGTIEGIEGFFQEAGGYDVFVIDGEVVFRSSLVILGVLSVLGVVGSVLGAVLFNLLSDLTGGVRMTVIDEDLIVAPVRPRRPAGPQARPAREQPNANGGGRGTTPATGAVGAHEVDPDTRPVP